MIRRTRSGLQAAIRKIAPLWPLLLPLVYYLPSVLGFPYPSNEAEFSDIAITHLPNYIYLKRSLLTEGLVPLWSPLLFSGTPFGANPLSGLWYPPGWLALVFTPHVGFALAAMAHVLWGGIGMYLLLRSEKLSLLACVFGAIAFESLPKILGHFGAGHLTLVYAVFWIPWLLWLSRFPVKGRFNWRVLYGPAIVLGLIFLADPRMAAYAGLLWMLWVALHLPPRGCRIRLSETRQFDLDRRLFTAGWFVAQTGIALLLAAVLAIPLAEFSRLSTRGGLSAQEILSFSLPPPRLLGILFPDYGGSHEFILYSGGMVLVLSVLAVLWPSVRRPARFWLIPLLASLVVALGTNLPLADMVAYLPGLSLLRVPARALFLTGLSLSALAAFGLNRLLTDYSQAEARTARLSLTAFLAVGLTAAIISAAAGLGPSSGFFCGGVLLCLAAAWVWAGLTGRLGVRLWFGGVIVLSLLDWGLMNRTLLNPRDPGVVLEERSEVAEFISSQTGTFRVYSPSYGLPQQTAANQSILLADGVDPLHLESYSKFMESATGVPRQGYAVSVPPFEGGDPHRANSAYLPDPGLLGLLNVRFVVADFEILTSQLRLIEGFDGVRVYENLATRPRAWLQPESAAAGFESAGVHEIQEDVHSRVVRVDGPGTLVYSEVYYPGWRVFVDGDPSPVRLVEGLLLGAEIGPGEHEVEFRFSPGSLYLGLAVTIGAWLGLGALVYTKIICFFGICNGSER